MTTETSSTAFTLNFAHCTFFLHLLTTAAESSFHLRFKLNIISANVK